MGHGEEKIAAYRAQARAKGLIVAFGAGLSLVIEELPGGSLGLNGFSMRINRHALFVIVFCVVCAGPSSLCFSGRVFRPVFLF